MSYPTENLEGKYENLETADDIEQLARLLNKQRPQKWVMKDGRWVIQNSKAPTPTAQAPRFYTVTTGRTSGA